MPEQKKCFIIQPLTDPYKKQCDATYKPAIKRAGLEPYRVDEHYTQKLKIEAIKEEIEKSAVCLAEITENNPNVWYELGFADGHDIPVVLICNETKRSVLPFDLNQRDTYFYKTDGQGDWENLQKQITERLKSAIRLEATGNTGDSPISPVISHEREFGRAALFALSVFYYDSADDGFSRELSQLRIEMRQSGFDDRDITDALTHLQAEEMIKRNTALIVSRGGVWHSLTNKGMNWCFQNKELVRKAKVRE